MIVKIKKRDGRTVTFNIEKIAQAIYKAAESVGGSDYETALELSGKVVDMLMSQNITTPTVEQIQDCVEKVLIEEGHAATAKSYMLYRSERTRAREMDTKLMKVYEDLTFKSAEDSDLKRENANIDGDTAMGTMLKYGSVGAKEFYEMYVLEEDHARAHEEALDVLQAALHLVDEVLAFAGAVDAPRHRHLVVLRAELLLAVGEGDGHLGEAEGLARVGAVEHHVHELRAADRRRALFAEHPADGVGDVRLAASVRPDDGDHARLERQARTVGEGFETDDV